MLPCPKQTFCCSIMVFILVERDLNFLVSCVNIYILYKTGSILENNQDFQKSTILINHIQLENRSDQFLTRHARHFELLISTCLKTSLTSFSMFPDWFSDKSLFFSYISAIPPGWLGGSITPIQHTHLS